METYKTCVQKCTRKRVKRVYKNVHVNVYEAYTKTCMKTYTKMTDQFLQEEECDENFKKRCFIEYKNVAFDEKVKFCFTPLVR